MTIKAYIAASFARRTEAMDCAHQLHRMGIDVVSTWHVGEHDGTPESHLLHDEQATIAANDWDDLERASLLIVLGDAPGCYEGHGGKFVELGIALAMGITVIVVSFRESVYGHHRDVIYTADWETARTYVSGLQVDSWGKVRAA